MRLAISENYVRKHYGFCESRLSRMVGVIAAALPNYRSDRRVTIADIATALAQSSKPTVVINSIDILLYVMAKDKRLPKNARDAATLAYFWDEGKAGRRIYRECRCSSEEFRRRERALFFRVLRRAEKRFLGQEKRKNSKPVTSP